MFEMLFRLYFSLFTIGAFWIGLFFFGWWIWRKVTAKVSVIDQRIEKRAESFTPEQIKRVDDTSQAMRTVVRFAIAFIATGFTLATLPPLVFMMGPVAFRWAWIEMQKDRN
jgi:hypothetical protein